VGQSSSKQGMITTPRARQPVAGAVSGCGIFWPGDCSGNVQDFSSPRLAGRWALGVLLGVLRLGAVWLGARGLEALTVGLDPVLATGRDAAERPTHRSPADWFWPSSRWRCVQRQAAHPVGVPARPGAGPSPRGQQARAEEGQQGAAQAREWQARRGQRRHGQRQVSCPLPIRLAESPEMYGQFPVATSETQGRIKRLGRNGRTAGGVPLESGIACRM
jgi:hypothetical protein